MTRWGKGFFPRYIYSGVQLYQPSVKLAGKPVGSGRFLNIKVKRCFGEESMGRNIPERL
jgi:hypothetical protein